MAKDYGNIVFYRTKSGKLRWFDPSKVPGGHLREETVGSKVKRTSMTPEREAAARKGLEKKKHENKYSEAQKNDHEFVNSALEEMKRYTRNWDYMSAREKKNISPNGGLRELRAKIKELENAKKAWKK